MLQSEVAHLLGVGPMNVIPAASHACAKSGVLTEEAIARMNRVGAGRQRRFYELILAKITLGGRRTAEAHRLVGTRHVQGVLVYI